MAISIGTVANLSGVFYVKDINGDERVLRVGDEIFDGEVVSGGLGNSASSKIDILLNNSNLMTLVQDQSQLFDISMLENTFGNEESAFNTGSKMPLFSQNEQKPEDILEEATAAGDESVLEEETAAGEEGGDPTSTDSGVFSFAQRDGDSVDINSDLRDTSFPSSENTTTPDSTYIEPAATTTTVPYYGVLTLSDVTVLEGTSSATITASVDNAPQTNLNIVLSNGATVTILAGQTSGVSSPFAIQGDDPYVDNESYTVSVSSTTGGNYESLDTSDTATVTISDTIDNTMVNVTTSDVNENASGVTYNFELTNKPDSGSPASLTVNVNGTSYNVSLDSDGKGSLFVSTQDSDVYNDSQSYTATVTSISGGNFEGTDVTGATATANVTDTGAIDTTTLTLSDVTVLEGTSSATITASVDNAPQTNLNIVLSNGATVTILAGQTSGVSSPFTIQGDDPYVDNESYTVSVSSTTGGNYESLDTSDTATVTISDTIDNTMVNVTTSDVNENASGVTYNFALTNKPDSGSPASLTVNVNGTSYNVSLDSDGKGSLFVSTQDSDVYNDSQSYTATVTSISGGNFEGTDVTGATATANVTDTGAIDTTTLTLSDVTVLEGTSSATITASVDNAPQTNLNIVLSNGATVTILAGQTSGVSSPFAIQGDDPYVDNESYTVSVSSTTGGNYESLDTSDTATVTISDTIDNTMVNVTTSDVNENASGVTYNFELTNKPDSGSPASLTVNVNGTSYNVSLDSDGKGSLFVSTQDSDVYNDSQSYTATVTSISGGNFEGTDVTGATATANVTDTGAIDTTTLTLSDVTVLEGTSSATITASVDNAPQTNLNIVLSNGATVTILAGQTSGVSSPFTIQGDDPYVDNESYTVSVSSTTGGNYESLDTSDTATVTISDTIDNTTVSLSVEPSTVASGDSVTVTATVTNTPQTNLTVNLVDESNNPLGTITILAGQTSGQTTITLSDDTTISIDSHSGGNYEKLLYGSDIGVVVPDAPIILSVDTHTVDEQHLYDGTQPDASQTVKIGSFVIVAEGGIASLQVGDENLSYDDLLNLSTTPITVESENGNTVTFTNFNSSTGEVTYIYSLNNAVEHADSDGENTLLEEFEIVLTDELSQTDEATLNINIIDDVPVLDITSGIIANTAGAELDGTLTNLGADSAGTLTWTGVTANITTSEGTQSNVTLTSMGENVNITYSGNVIAGTTADGDIVFTIIGNDDGTYTVNQYRTLDSSKLFETDGVLLSYGDGKKDSYVLYEGAGNNLVADLTPDTSKEWLAHFTATDSGGNAKINMSGNGIGVENNLLESSEKISIDLNDAKQFSSIKVSVNQQYDYGEGQYIAYYTDGTDSGLQTITVGTNGDFFIQSSDDAFLDRVEIIGVDNQFKIDGMNFYVVDDDRVPSLDLNFTAVDADGDDVSGSLSVTFDSTLDAIEGTEENDAIGGSDADEVLYGDDGDDILNGGEGEDELYGQDGDDELVYDDADSVIDGGAGFDTLKLLDGQGIDFDNLGTQQIKNIEEIELSDDDGSSTLDNLTLDAVRSLTDGNNQLVITGDDADQVTFKNTGTNEWSKVAGVGDELGFDIYTNSGDSTVRVLVEEEVVDEIQ